MTRVKRTLAILAIVLVALAGLGFIGRQVWLWYLGIDEPPADDSDLQPSRPDVPADQNAYIYLRKASEAAVWKWKV